MNATCLYAAVFVSRARDCWDYNYKILCSVKIEINLYFVEKMEESSSTDVLAAVVTSLLIAFLVISIFIFIAGFVCGHYFSQKFKRSSKETPQTTDHQVPFYEYVLHMPNAVKHQEQDLELKENVAYGPSKPATVEQ